MLLSPGHLQKQHARHSPSLRDPAVLSWELSILDPMDQTGRIPSGTRGPGSRKSILFPIRLMSVRQWRRPAARSRSNARLLEEAQALRRTGAMEGGETALPQGGEQHVEAACAQPILPRNAMLQDELPSEAKLIMMDVADQAGSSGPCASMASMLWSFRGSTIVPASIADPLTYYQGSWIPVATV